MIRARPAQSHGTADGFCPCGVVGVWGWALPLPVYGDDLLGSRQDKIITKSRFIEVDSVCKGIITDYPAPPVVLWPVVWLLGFTLGLWIVYRVFLTLQRVYNSS